MNEPLHQLETYRKWIRIKFNCIPKIVEGLNDSTANWRRRPVCFNICMFTWKSETDYMVEKKISRKFQVCTGRLKSHDRSVILSGTDRNGCIYYSDDRLMGVI